MDAEALVSGLTIQEKVDELGPLDLSWLVLLVCPACRLAALVRQRRIDEERRGRDIALPERLSRVLSLLLVLLLLQRARRGGRREWRELRRPTDGIEPLVR